MVGADCRARITDFGLSQDQGAVEGTGAISGGTVRWTAPEILQGQGTPSKQADVFSFAMVMVEVGLGRSVCDRPLADCLRASLKTFTGTTPFDPLPPTTVALAIMLGDRPERPIHPEFTHGLWGLMQHCWSQEPQSRPTMFAVLDVLHGRWASLSSHDQVPFSLIVLLRVVGPSSVRGRFPHPHAHTRITGRATSGPQGTELRPRRLHPLPQP